VTILGENGHGGGQNVDFNLDQSGIRITLGIDDWKPEFCPDLMRQLWGRGISMDQIGRTFVFSCNLREPLPGKLLAFKVDFPYKLRNCAAAAGTWDFKLDRPRMRLRLGIDDWKPEFRAILM